MPEELPPAWQPITNPILVRPLVKLLEELGECTAAAARCLHQGLDGTEPTTGKINKQWLEEEIADVYACLEVAVHKLDLGSNKIDLRIRAKTAKLLKWQESKPDV